MIHSEIESFISKFKTIANAGINASLMIKTEAGKATVTLTAEVDVAQSFSSLLPRGGPARQRRRLRRAAARASAEVADAESVARESPAVEKETASEPFNEDVDAVKDTIVANSTEKVDTTNHNTVEVDPILVAAAVDPIENVVEKAVESVPSKSPLAPSHHLADDTKTTKNHCQKCEFVGKTEAGLKTHMTLVHKQKSLMKSFTRVTCAK